MNIFIKIAEGAGSGAEFVCKNYCQAARVIVFVKKIMNIVFFIVPMLLIVMLSFDFFKNVIFGSEDEAKKNTSLAIKRIIAAIILFLIPHIINTTASALEFAGVKGAKLYRLATEENLDTDIFNQLEKEFPESPEVPESTNGASGSNQGNKKVVSSSTSYKLNKNYVVIGHCSGVSNCSKINNYTIKITNKAGKNISNNNFTYKIDNKAIASVSTDGKIKAKFGGKTNVYIYPKKNPNQKLKLELVVINSIYMKVKTTKDIQAKNINTGKIETIKEGVKGKYNGVVLSKGESYGRGNILKVGNNYYKVSHNDVEPYDYNIVDVFSIKEAEEFVNSHGFKSSTKYLFWSSHGAQVEYMFTGSKGKWKSTKINGKNYAIINTGDLLKYGASTGVHLNKYIVGKRQYWTGYSMDVMPKKNDGFKGFTNPWHQYGTGKRRPASHGCTRFMTKNGDLQWLLKNNKKFAGSRIIDY